MADPSSSSDPSPFIDHTPSPYLADITRLFSAADTANEDVVDWIEVRGLQWERN